MKFILGQKIGMTQVFTPEGVVVPVTRVKAGPCQVVQVKADTKAVQVGFGAKKEFRLTKPLKGHLKGLEPVRWLKDFSVENTESLKRGDVITVETFAKGDTVKVTGTSKGKGFAGVVKRYNFKGGPATHGQKHEHRAPGSIGATGPARVFKGTRMAGRMGGETVTVANLEIVEVNPEENELYIKGAVPGARNGLVMITGQGELVLKQEEKPVEETPKTEEKVEETKKEEAPAEEVKAEEKPAEEKVEEAPAEKEENK